MVQRYDTLTNPPGSVELVPDDAGRFVSYADYVSVAADLESTQQQLDVAKLEIEKRVDAIKAALAELELQGAEINALRALLTQMRAWIDDRVPRPPPPGIELMRAAFEEFARKVTPK